MVLVIISGIWVIAVTLFCPESLSTVDIPSHLQDGNCPPHTIAFKENVATESIAGSDFFNTASALSIILKSSTHDFAGISQIKRLRIDVSKTQFTLPTSSTDPMIIFVRTENNC